MSKCTVIITGDNTDGDEQVLIVARHQQDLSSLNICKSKLGWEGTLTLSANIPGITALALSHNKDICQPTAVGRLADLRNLNICKAKH